MGAPAVMPVISRGVPAFTNDDFSGAFPASNANDTSYGGQHYWRCLTAPTGNTDSGTLTQAVYLAYDLSGVPAGQRGQVVLAWFNDPSTDGYDSSLIGVNYNNVARDYTIDVNPAAGGSLPTTGWVTKATVTSNPYHSRQHVIDMTGNNWIRINVTGVTGSISNNNVALNMDIHDAHLGVQDSWLMLGDSITQRGFDHDDIALGPILAAQINTLKSSYFPCIEDGGLGGFTAADGAAHIATWLSVFPGKYVGLNFGTNDANGGGSLLTNFQANMTTMINAVIAAGKIPVIPTIPWGNTTNLLANVSTLNTVIQGLYTTFPQIVKGPDLYAYFNAHQSEIGSDGIHPTDPFLSTGNGYVDYRSQWAAALVANVYAAKIHAMFPRHRRGFLFN